MNRKEWLEQTIKENAYTVGAELGVLRGPTFKHLIKKCPELTLYGVDVFYHDKDWKSKNITTTEALLAEEPVEWYHDLVEFSRQHSPRAHIVRNFTASAAKHIDDEFLDFVFIDAGHSYKAVKEDILAWYPKVKKGGMISGHDIDLPDVRKAVDEEFGSNVLSGISIAGYKTGPDNIWYLRKDT